MKLLLVEDDDITAEFIKLGLREDGHVVDQATTGREALLNLAMSSYDGMILDLNLPDMSGFDVAETVRGKGGTVPILMLTSESATDAVVRGLNSGADDYLTKPFKVEELKARIRALTRRGGATRSEEITVGSLVLNRLKREVSHVTRPLRLTPKEYQLLEYFLMRPGQAISRTELLEKVWEIQFDPHSNVVDVHVTRLRKKLREIDGAPNIETLRGSGYILEAG